MEHKHLTFSGYRVESFVLLSPEERYLKYMKDYPQVIHRAPDKYLAHVLGSPRFPSVESEAGLRLRKINPLFLSTVINQVYS